EPAIPGGGERAQRSRRGVESVDVDSVVHLTARSFAVDEAGALEDGEVFADSLPGDGQAVSKGRGCRFATLEQPIEKLPSGWFGDGGDELRGIDVGRTHRLYSSCRRNQLSGSSGPRVSLRPRGARSSHWYMPQRPSRPRA